MLRARWWLLAAWTVGVAVLASLAIAAGWAWPSTSSGFEPVERRATAERALRVAAEESLSALHSFTPDAGSGTPTVPTRLTDAVATAALNCEDGLPFTRSFVGYASEIEVRLLDVRRADLASDQFANLEATSDHTFIELTIEVENRGDETEYPSNHVVVVDGAANVSRRAWDAPSVDWLGPVDGGRTAAGVLVFDVPTAGLGDDASSVHVVAGSPLYDDSAVAEAMNANGCVTVLARKVGGVGDSPLVTAGRRVR